MKRLKKALSLLLVAAIAVTALVCGSVSASAASSKTALLTTALSKIDSKAKEIIDLGQGIYWLYDNDTGYNAFYRIGSDEIKAWRSSGKLKATKLTADDKLKKCTGYYTDCTFAFGDYALFYKDDNDIRTEYVIKYDKSKKTLTTIYSSKNYIGVSSDGSISEFIWNDSTGKLQLKILNNKAKLVKQLNYDFSAEDCIAHWNVFRYGSDTACISYCSESEYIRSATEDIKSGHIITIDKNGKTKTVAEFANTAFMTGGNYIVADRPPLAGLSYVYLTSKNKGYSTLDLRGLEDEIFKKDGVVYAYTISSFGKKIYGTKAVAEYVAGPEDDLQYKYALVNISSNKLISAVYDGMYTDNDGETYSVMNSKGQRGFLNSKGKKLAMFDDADSFYGKGKYAPVIKDGKIYLINMKMNQVSKTIKADKDSEVWTFGDELFAYRYGGKVYLMTNKK